MRRGLHPILWIFLVSTLSLRPAPSPFPLTILYTGEIQGYLEPCGCAEFQLGGFPRRFGYLRSHKGIPLLLVDNGDLSRGVGRQEELKAETALQAMNEMNYSAMNLGEGDLLLGTLNLMGMAQIARFPFLSANVTLKEGTPYFTTYTLKTFSYGGKDWKMGITGILGREFKDEVSEDYQFSDPEESLPSVLEELVKNADLILLLAHTGREEAREIAKRFPSINVIVTGHGEDEPLEEPERVGETLLLNSGSKGQYMGRLRLILEKVRGVIGEEHEVVALTEGIVESPLIRSLLDDYQKRIEMEDLLHKFPKTPHSSRETHVGSEACKWCHREDFEIWQRSKHAVMAHPSIVEAGHRYDPECVICHSTGFRYEGGFTSLEETPHLAPMGCENCHGPRSQHIKNPKRKVNAAKPTETTCKACHDPDNSPHFEFESYWAKIKH